MFFGSASGGEAERRAWRHPKGKGFELCQQLQVERLKAEPGDTPRATLLLLPAASSPGSPESSQPAALTAPLPGHAGIPPPAAGKVFSLLPLPSDPGQPLPLHCFPGDCLRGSFPAAMQLGGPRWAQVGPTSCRPPYPMLFHLQLLLSLWVSSPHPTLAGGSHGPACSTLQEVHFLQQEMSSAWPWCAERAGRAHRELEGLTHPAHAGGLACGGIGS